MADYLIEKVGENDVQVILIIPSEDIDGNPISIAGDTIHYGQTKIDDELKIASAQLEVWNGILQDPKTYAQSQLDVFQAKVDRLNQIQQAMDGINNQKIDTRSVITAKPISGGLSNAKTN